VDAGYFDNYGIDVASSWLYQHRQWLRENTSGVVLIQLRDGRSNTRRRQLADPDEEARPWLPRAWATSLQWLTGPLDGAGAAYVAVSSFRNDEQVQILSDWFNGLPARAGDAGPFFTTVVFERPGQTGMNWYLNEDDMKDIRDGMTADPQNQAVLRLLVDWWKEGGASR
jgi:hypothetical protein